MEVVLHKWYLDEVTETYVLSTQHPKTKSNIFEQSRFRLTDSNHFHHGEKIIQYQSATMSNKIVNHCGLPWETEIKPRFISVAQEFVSKINHYSYINMENQHLWQKCIFNKRLLIL